MSNTTKIVNRVIINNLTAENNLLYISYKNKVHNQFQLYHCSSKCTIKNPEKKNILETISNTRYSTYHWHPLG